MKGYLELGLSGNILHLKYDDPFITPTTVCNAFWGFISPDGIFHIFLMEGLQHKIAEKLDCFSVKLTYRLENDKVKESSMAIQSQEDFVHFMGHMRLLAVWPKTASGKASTRALKPFRVIFENANKPLEPLTNRNGKKSGKWVRH